MISLLSMKTYCFYFLQQTVCGVWSFLFSLKNLKYAFLFPNIQTSYKNPRKYKVKWRLILIFLYIYF